MPELAELYLASEFVNRVAAGKVFNRIFKSAVSKCGEVIVPDDWERTGFSISKSVFDW